MMNRRMTRTGNAKKNRVCNLCAIFFNVELVDPKVFFISVITLSLISVNKKKPRASELDR